MVTAGHRNLKICVAQKRRDLNKRGILLISTPQTIDAVYHDGACSLVPMETLPIDTTIGRNKQIIEIDGTKSHLQGYRQGWSGTAEALVRVELLVGANCLSFHVFRFFQEVLFSP